MVNDITKIPAVIKEIHKKEQDKKEQDKKEKDKKEIHKKEKEKPKERKLEKKKIDTEILKLVEGLKLPKELEEEKEKDATLESIEKVIGLQKLKRTELSKLKKETIMVKEKEIGQLPKELFEERGPLTKKEIGLLSEFRMPEEEIKFLEKLSMSRGPETTTTYLRDKLRIIRERGIKLHVKGKGIEEEAIPREELLLVVEKKAKQMLPYLEMAIKPEDIKKKIEKEKRIREIQEHEAEIKAKTEKRLKEAEETRKQRELEIKIRLEKRLKEAEDTRKKRELDVKARLEKKKKL